MGILEKAIEVTNKRSDTYGHPLDDFGRTAKMWEGILGISVTPEQVGLCMIAVKLSRHCHMHKIDNLVDIAGYADTIQRCFDEKIDRETRTETFGELSSDELTDMLNTGPPVNYRPGPPGQIPKT